MVFFGINNGEKNNDISLRHLFGGNAKQNSTEENGYVSSNAIEY